MVDGKRQQQDRKAKRPYKHNGELFNLATHTHNLDSKGYVHCRPHKGKGNDKLAQCNQRYGVQDLQNMINNQFAEIATTTHTQT